MQNKDSAFTNFLLIESAITLSFWGCIIYLCYWVYTFYSNLETNIPMNVILPLSMSVIFSIFRLISIYKLQMSIQSK